MLSNHEYFLRKFSISDAAIAYRKPRSTILKYIRSGDFELDYNNLIDYAQLVKKFGELSSNLVDSKDEQIKKLKNEILDLRKQILFLKKSLND